MDKEQFKKLIEQLEKLNSTLEGVESKLADIENGVGLLAYTVQMWPDKQK